MAAKIKALINGPYQVSGGVTVEDATGKTIVAEKDVWLCRCGASKNKPFCDGAHAKIGFKADNKNSRNPIIVTIRNIGLLESLFSDPRSRNGSTITVSGIRTVSAVAQTGSIYFKN